MLGERSIFIYAFTIKSAFSFSHKTHRNKIFYRSFIFYNINTLLMIVRNSEEMWTAL